MRHFFSRYTRGESALLILILFSFAIGAFSPFAAYFFSKLIIPYNDPWLEQPGYQNIVFLYCAIYTILLISPSFLSTSTFKKTIQKISLFLILLFLPLILFNPYEYAEDILIEPRFGSRITYLGTFLALVFAMMHYYTIRKQEVKKQSPELLDQF